MKLCVYSYCGQFVHNLPLWESPLPFGCFPISFLPSFPLCLLPSLLALLPPSPHLLILPRSPSSPSGRPLIIRRCRRLPVGCAVAPHPSAASQQGARKAGAEKKLLYIPYRITSPPIYSLVWKAFPYVVYRQSQLHSHRKCQRKKCQK